MKATIGALLTFLILCTNCYAEVTDSFFHYVNNTDDKIEILRKNFSVNYSEITDEELKSFVKKNDEYVDSIITRYNLGKGYDAWLAANEFINIDIEKGIAKHYWKNIFDPSVGEILKYLQGANYVFSIQMMNIYGYAKTAVETKASYNDGLDALSNHESRNMLSKLYNNYYVNDISSGINPLNEGSASSTYYDEAKQLEGKYYEEFLLAKGWTQELAYANLLDVCDCIYTYHNQSRRDEIGKSIIDIGISQGIIREIKLFAWNDSIVQGESIQITGEGFSKNSSVQCSVLKNQDPYEEFLLTSDPEGFISLTKGTSCDTEQGTYKYIFTDVATGKLKEIEITVANSQACDSEAPFVVGTMPTNNDTSVDIETNSLCIEFSEPMKTIGSYQINMPSEVSLIDLDWATSTEACLTWVGTFPYNETITWELNQSCEDDCFQDLAGNILENTWGSFTTQNEPVCTGDGCGTPADDGCASENADLVGDFAVVTLSAGDGNWSFAEFGTVTFDGADNYTKSVEYSLTGVGANLSDSYSGTYTVNNDGTVAGTEERGTWTGAVSASGDMYIGTIINNANVQVISIGIKKGGSEFTNADLNGAFSEVVLGAGDKTLDYETGEWLADWEWSMACFGTTTFDGLSIDGFGSFTDDLNASLTDVGANFPWPASGSYTVNNDGTWEGSDWRATWTGAVSASGDIFVDASVSDVHLQSIAIGIKSGGDGFTNNSLNGTYEMVTLAMGNGDWSLAERSTATCNGAGTCNITSLVSGTYVGADVAKSGSVTYNVNPDGTFVMTDSIPDSIPPTFRGAISLAEDMFIYAGIDDMGAQEIGIGIKTGAP